ncbi:MAG: TatD family hydrolase [Elusimicrobiota bacterium]
MIDSHTHLSDEKFNQDRDDVINHCIKSGIKKFIEVLCSKDEWGKISLFDKYKENFFFSFGIHPHYTEQSTDEDFKKLEEYITTKRCVAIGETGIDLWYYPDKLKEQLNLLEKQIEISNKTKKPLIFHIRNPKGSDRAYSSFFDFIPGKINNGNYIPAVIHSFSGEINDARKAIDMGFLIGINATITYPKNQSLREIIKNFGINSSIVETDCPYLPPQRIRGKRNDPTSIIEIISAISEITKMKYEDVEDKINSNFNLFLSKNYI